MAISRVTNVLVPNAALPPQHTYSAVPLCYDLYLAGFGSWEDDFFRLPPSKCGITPPSLVVLIWSRSPLFGPIPPCIFQLSILLHFPLRDGLTSKISRLGRLLALWRRNQPTTRKPTHAVGIPPSCIHYIGSRLPLIDRR